MPGSQIMLQSHSVKMVPAQRLSLTHARAHTHTHPADQWKPIVNPEINPGSYVFPTFKKVAKTRVLGGKTSLFNKWCYKAWIHLWKNKIRPLSFNTVRKINSKWIKYFNLRPETLKLLEKNRRDASSISRGRSFLKLTFIAQQIKASQI